MSAAFAIAGKLDRGQLVRAVLSAVPPGGNKFVQTDNAVTGAYCRSYEVTTLLYPA